MVREEDIQMRLKSQELGEKATDSTRPIHFLGYVTWRWFDTTLKKCPIVCQTHVLVPSQAGTPGNERVVQKAKQRPESSQPEVPLTVKIAKSMITSYIDESTASTRKQQEPWKVKGNPGLLRSYPEAPGKNRNHCLFRLTTEYDLLQA
ncbi:hypothetical protein TNCV_1021721 [Trichonephila clavipes]|uniref:Uncharacterized protein n=1 Tax=Trichonephila clavipes TaxID=2585209 RepID=A0A8X6VDI2_TRICX|nr:hypothetical protein TNCV_1021721 [Trichonephila clavipes]